MSEDHFKVQPRLVADPFRLIQPNESIVLPHRGTVKQYDLQRTVFQRFPLQPPLLPYHPDLKSIDWRYHQFDLRHLLASNPQSHTGRKLEATEQAAVFLTFYMEMKRQAERNVQQALSEKYDLWRQSLAKQRFHVVYQEFMNMLMRLRERDRRAERSGEGYASADLQRQVRQDLQAESREQIIATQSSNRDAQELLALSRSKRQAAGMDQVQNWAALALGQLATQQITFDAARLSLQAKPGVSEKLVELIGRSAYATAAKR